MRLLLESSQKTAIVYGEKSLTYEQLLCHVSEYSALLKRKKAGKLLIFSENRAEYIYAMYAAFKNGETVIPIDHLCTVDELLYILKDCAPETIVTSRRCLSTVTTAIKGIKGTQKKPDIFVFEKMKTRSKGIPENIPIDNPETTAFIIYTSGTTGSPKGVMLSFKNIICNVDAVAEVGIYSKSESYLVLLPIHHVLPLLGTVVAPLMVQAKIAICPSTATDDILNTLAAGEVSVIVGVPRLYEALDKGIIDKINARFITRMVFKTAAFVNSKTFSKKLFKQVHSRFGGHIKYLISGGAAFDQKIIRNFTTLGFTILEGYGMTEAAPIISFPRPDNINLATSGQPLPGVKIKIQNGEILVKGQNIMQGYYKKPSETSAVLKNGWLHTGDLGVLDENNFLTITGRKKDIIVLSNGKNINPEEIEDKLIASSPFIQEAAVFMKENKLQAVIRLKRGNTNDSQSEQKLAYDIISAYNNSASSYKKLMKYHITQSEIPRTRLGKIKRAELDTLGEEHEKKDMKEPKYKEYSMIRDFLENETGTRIHPNDHFEFDIGLDSLSKVSLAVFLEKTFGIKLKDGHLSHYPDLLKLSAYVKDNKNKFQENIINWAYILKEKVQVKLPKSWFTTNIFAYPGKGLLKIFFNLKTKGIENIPPSPFILAPNHQSAFDGIFVASFLKRALLKKTYFYAKVDHFRNRFMKFFARISNTVVVDINNDLKGSIQALAAVLKENKNIIIFPEGTRTKDGKLGDFKHTFAILSKELKIPVVPVAISGAYEIKPAGKRIPRFFKQVSVHFLKPVDPQNKSYGDIVDTVRRSINRDLDSKKAS